MAVPELLRRMLHLYGLAFQEVDFSSPVVAYGRTLVLAIHFDHDVPKILVVFGARQDPGRLSGIQRLPSAERLRIGICVRCRDQKTCGSHTKPPGIVS